MRALEKNVIEAETRMFWKFTAQLRAAYANGEDTTELLDDLDTIRQMTESEMLKARCTDIMLQYAGRQNDRRVLA